jgi:hypothetical protein
MLHPYQRQHKSKIETCTLSFQKNFLCTNAAFLNPLALFRRSNCKSVFYKVSESLWLPTIGNYLTQWSTTTIIFHAPYQAEKILNCFTKLPDLLTFCNVRHFCIQISRLFFVLRYAETCTRTDFRRARRSKGDSSESDQLRDIQISSTSSGRTDGSRWSRYSLQVGALLVD